MSKLEETEANFILHVRNRALFDRVKPKQLDDDVQMLVGRIDNTNRWEIQSYIFDKSAFKAKTDVIGWLDRHFRAESRSVLDYGTWTEHRRRVIGAFVEVSKLE